MPEGGEAAEAGPGAPVAFDDAGFEEGTEEEDGGQEEGFEGGEEAGGVVAHEVEGGEVGAGCWEVG